MTIQTMHFHGSIGDLEPETWIRLYETARRFISTLDAVDQSEQFTFHCGAHWSYYLLAASCVLIRILRGGIFSCWTPANLDQGEETFFLAVRLMRLMSVENDDAPARCASALSRMWTSRHIFNRPDGTKSPELRVRSRLAMSHVIDCLWWWREEFGGQPNAYPPPRAILRRKKSEREQNADGLDSNQILSERGFPPATDIQPFDIPDDMLFSQWTSLLDTTEFAVS